MALADIPERTKQDRKAAGTVIAALAARYCGSVRIGRGQQRTLTPAPTC